MRYGCTETSFGDTSSSEIFLYAFHFMEVYFCCWKIMALPLTTSLAGLEAKASWASKAEAVTWHSHKPSSNLMSMARMLRLQSPVPGRAAHSYFPLYSPIGWKEIQKFRNRRITRFWCAFRWAIQLLLQKFLKRQKKLCSSKMASEEGWEVIHSKFSSCALREDMRLWHCCVYSN